MNETVSLLICTADRTRQASIELDRRMTVAQVLDACRQNWKLPYDVGYQLVNARSGKGLLPSCELAKEHVLHGDELLVHPMLVAGGQ